MSSTFFGFFDKVFIVLLGKVYIVVLCKCGTKCRGKGLFRKFSPTPASREPPRRGGLSGAQRLMAPSARELSAKLTEGENLPIEPIIPCANKE